MKIGEEAELKLYPKICCEICNEVIHNHFECPVCGDSYAPSDIYGEVDFDADESISCKTCGSEFEIVKGYINNKIKLLIKGELK